MRFSGFPVATLSHEMKVNSSSKTEVKLQFPGSRCNPFARNDGRSPKTEVKFDLFCVYKASVCSVSKCLCVKASVCKSFCV